MLRSARSILHPFQNMLQSANAEPPVAIRFDDDVMFAVRPRFAVIRSQKIRTQVTVLRPHIHGDALRSAVDIVNRQESVVAPVVSQSQDATRSGIENRRLSPAKLGTLLSQADHSLGPVQQ